MRQRAPARWPAVFVALVAALGLVGCKETAASTEGQTTAHVSAPDVSTPDVVAAGQMPYRRPEPRHPNHFFIAEHFFAGERAARDPGPGRPYENGAIQVGIVPHHLVAGALISGFFLQLAKAPPPAVILVGPNHDNRGPPIATSRWGWATPFGTVSPALAIIDDLTAQGLAAPDPAALSPEHSIGGLMPYIKFYLPKAAVAPLILHGSTGQPEIERLASALLPHLKNGALLIGSVDFSHYLTRAEAARRDELTWRAIADYDLTAIFQMGNEHLDSPASLALVMTAAHSLKLSGPVRAAHQNSGELIGSDFAETTSYMVIQYRRAGERGIEPAAPARADYTIRSSSSGAIGGANRASFAAASK